MANIYKRFKKYDEAIKLYSEVMQSVEKDLSIYADLLYKRGGSYERLGNYGKSDIDLLAALKIIPDNSYVLNYLAYSWLERDYKISKAIKIKPDFVEAHYNLGIILHELGEYQKAVNSYEKAIKINPNNPKYYVNRGSIKYDLGFVESACEDWNRAIELNSKIINNELIEINCN